jgi:hypothetical protein
MGKILEFLTPEWVEKRLQEEKAPPAPMTEERVERLLQMALRVALKASPTDTDVELLKGTLRRDFVEAERKKEELDNQPKWRVQSLISRCISLCECEYAAGSAATVIREHCRVAGVQALPDLRRLDCSNVSDRLHDLSQLDLGYVAAVSGDLELARSLTSPFQFPALSKVNRGQVRTEILRCALAGDTDGEHRLAALLEPGYPADIPPQLIELPLGVVGRDPTMILEGVRKIGVRFKGKWDSKTHRAFYDKRQPKTPDRPHPSGTWEQFVERTKQHLFGLHWIFSWWAIAWLQIARQRGLDGVFDTKNKKAFSEWAPLALVDAD